LRGPRAESGSAKTRARGEYDAAVRGGRNLRVAEELVEFCRASPAAFVLSAEVVAGAMPSAGATARRAAEIGGVIGVGGVGGGYGVSWLAEKILMAPDDSEPTK